jgi:hypothetical protein
MAGLICADGGTDRSCARYSRLCLSTRAIPPLLARSWPSQHLMRGTQGSFERCQPNPDNRLARPWRSYLKTSRWPRCLSVVVSELVCARLLQAIANPFQPARQA